MQATVAMDSREEPTLGTPGGGPKSGFGARGGVRGCRTF